MLRNLGSKGSKGSNKRLYGTSWGGAYPMIGSMVIAKDVGDRMMKEYFEVEASKETPQYRFQKGLNLYGNEGYQAAKDKLE